jgi:hypothetical protein
MIRQHDAASPNAYAFGAASDMAYQYRSGSTGNARHAMVFCQPVTLIAPALTMLSQAEGIAEGLRSITAFGNR